MSFVTIETKDGRDINGVNVQGWESYQEALNRETNARGLKPAIVKNVWKEGKIIQKH